jgi:hypothetical protein
MAIGPIDKLKRRLSVVNMVPDALASSQTYTGGARKLPSFTSKLGGLAESITKGKS